MEFELGPAILAGLIAGAIMEGPVYMQKAMGLPVKQNIFRTWGQNLLGIKGTAKIPSLDPATGAIRARASRIATTARSTSRPRWSGT